MGAEFRRSGASHDPGEESSEKGTRRSDEERHGYPSGVASRHDEFARHSGEKPDHDPADDVHRLPLILLFDQHMVAEA